MEGGGVQPWVRLKAAMAFLVWRIVELIGSCSCVQELMKVFIGGI